MSKHTKLGQKLPWNYLRYVLALLIWIIGFFPSTVSQLYTPFVFRPLSAVLRFISGLFSFSIGEWVYLGFIIALIFSILNWIWLHYTQWSDSAYWKLQLVRWLNQLTGLFIVFELCWGLNYQKLNPSKDFDLQVPSNYTEKQMDSLSVSLINDLNSTRSKISDFEAKNLHFETILNKIGSDFKEISRKRPFLHYSPSSIKLAQFPSWGDYLGYTAFYHPITGEAIIRGDLPILTQAFTISHEMAHQLGYASEEEANFIAFVIGTESRDPIVQYSTQLQMFTYAQYAHLQFIVKRGDFKLYQKVVERNKKLLLPKVIEDRKFIRNFFLKKQDLQIKGTAEMYNQFLLWNKQARGIESYEDVLLWSLAYKTKKNP